jgi:hypothetical protein
MPIAAADQTQVFNFALLLRPHSPRATILKGTVARRAIQASIRLTDSSPSFAFACDNVLYHTLDDRAGNK